MFKNGLGWRMAYSQATTATKGRETEHRHRHHLFYVLRERGARLKSSVVGRQKWHDDHIAVLDCNGVVGIFSSQEVEIENNRPLALLTAIECSDSQVPFGRPAAPRQAVHKA